MAEIYHDRTEQLEKIQAAVLPGEAIEAVFEMKGGGTGFLGVTSRRVVFYDKVFLRRMKAIVSIPYSRITSIAAEDESGLLTGRGFFASSTVVLIVGRESYQFEFRGSDKAHFFHNLILSHLV